MLNKIKFFVLTTTLLFCNFGFGQVMISQYIDTDSGTTPKGIEIFNYSTTDIIFSGTNNLQISQGTNGNPCNAITATNITSGTLKAGEVWVIGTTDLVTYAINNGTNLSGTTDYTFTFNGDDALELYLGGTLMDVFGTCGSDPGSSWSGGGISTADENLQILGGICTGTTTYWTDPSLRFESVASGSIMTNFGNSPVGCLTILPEPSNHPSALSCTTISDSEFNLNWTDATGVQEPNGYLIKWSNISYADIVDPIDGSTANGANSTTVAQGIETTLINGLIQNTQYFFKIYPYTNSGGNIDYKTNGTIEQTDCVTDVGPCASESLTNNNAPGNTYTSGSFVGDDGFTWEYSEARNPDTTHSINGTSIGFSDSGTRHLKASTTGGIGDLTFSMRSYFAGGGAADRTLEVWINGVLQGSYTLTSMDTVETYTLSNINVSGAFTIEFRSVGNRQLVLDDISWTCYTSSNTITTSTVSPLTYNVDCSTGDVGDVDFTSSGVFNAGNIFTAQLSDAIGSFASPINIGSLSGPDAEGTDPESSINFTIPAGTPAGTAYRIRVVSSDPSIIGSPNVSDIEIINNPCIIDITSLSSMNYTVDCNTSDNGSLSFTSSGTYSIGNVFTAELSDPTGSFASPLTIGTFTASGSNPTGTISFTIPAGTAAGTAYRIRIVSSDPVVIGDDNGTDITINATLCPSQLPSSGGLLINEFSNGDGGNKEYYEFIVAGRCGETVDVRGYIIDDNNGTFTDYAVTGPDASSSGIAEGHLRLTNDPQWADIPVGSLIVIYNSSDPNSNLPADDPYDNFDAAGNSNPDSLYVMSQNQPDLLEITSDLPVAGASTVTHDSTYTPVTYNTSSWNPLSIANDGDAVQIRSPNGDYFHGVSYGGSTITGGPDNMKIYNGSMSGMSGWFNSGDIFDINNWSIGDVNIAGNETPGLPNNTNNETWLKLMRDPATEVCPVTPLPISLINFYSEKETDGLNLLWETETEQNNSHFNLYHSLDGFKFRKIGKVLGNGNSSTSITYEFLDTRPTNGVSYYKLESVDFDGTIHQKGIISAIYESSYVYYNYSTSRLVFDSKSDYEIYSPEGRLIDRAINASSHPFHGKGIFFIVNTKNGEKHKVYLRN